MQTRNNTSQTPRSVEAIVSSFRRATRQAAESIEKGTNIDADQLLTLRAVSRLTGWSRSSLYRKIADQTFPPPLKVGAKKVMFRAADVQVWLRSQPIAETKGAQATANST